MAASPIATFFETACTEHADRTAIATPTEDVTYRELHRRAARFAGTLRARGVAPGDRVAVWLPNGVDWLVAHWGVALAGAIVVPLGGRLRAPEARHILAQSETCALVMVDRFQKSDYVAMLGEIRASLPPLKTVIVRSAGAAVDDEGDEWSADIPADADDVHMIQYTSGTTGHPRGAVLGQRDLLRVAFSHAASWSAAPGEAVFIPNPFSHIMGMVLGALVPPATGATLITMPLFDAAEALALIAKHDVVAMAGTPSHYLALADRADVAAPETSRVRVAMSGGAPLTPRTLRHIVERLHLPALVNGFGMSEASGSVTRTSKGETPESICGSIGRPMPWLEIRVVDVTTGAEVDAGELWIRGPGVMRGYFRMPEATAAVLSADGWLKTGDLVRRRGDGVLEYVGRLKEMIIVGGFNVYPAEVERALLEDEAVAAACVVGVPDDRLGEAPFAFVVLRAGAAAPELLSSLKQRIANYKVPRTIELRDALPMLGSGKVDRLRLRDEAQGLVRAKG